MHVVAILYDENDNMLDSEVVWSTDQYEANGANETIEYEKGHKNSRGEDAPWVIRDHKDNRVLASFPTKKEAKKEAKKSEADSSVIISKLENLRDATDADKVKSVLSKLGFDIIEYGWLDSSQGPRGGEYSVWKNPNGMYVDLDYTLVKPNPSKDSWVDGDVISYEYYTDKADYEDHHGYSPRESKKSEGKFTEIKAAIKAAWSAAEAKWFRLDFQESTERLDVYPIASDNEGVGVNWGVLPERNTIVQYATDLRTGDSQIEREMPYEDLDELEEIFVDEFKSMDETLEVGADNGADIHPLTESALNAATFAEPSFEADEYGLEEISKNDSGEIEVVDAIDSNDSAQVLADEVDALHKRHPEKKYHIIAIGTDSDGIEDESEVIWSDYPEEVSVDETAAKTEATPLTESAPKEVDTVLKKNAPKLIDILNAKFKAAGFDVALKLTDPKNASFSDGWYLNTKSIGNWDSRSRMFNLRLAGTEYNGVVYKDGNIYLKKGARPASNRGTVAHPFGVGESRPTEREADNFLHNALDWASIDDGENRIILKFIADAGKFALVGYDGRTQKTLTSGELFSVVDRFRELVEMDQADAIREFEKE
jgi:hypothetical protein